MHHSHPECQDEILDYEQTFSQCQSTVTKVRARRSESEARRAELRDALNLERVRNSELQQRVHQIFSTLEKEKAKCDEYYADLKTALIKHSETLEEKQKLAVDLQKAQDSYSRLQEKHKAESDSQLRRSRETEL